MISTFTYPLPVEQFVAGIGTTVGTYTYDGPDSIDYTIQASGHIVEVGLEPDHVVEPPLLKRTFNCGIASHLPFCYYYMDTVNDDYHWDHVNKDVLMENGDVYHEITNPNLNDNYDVRYNENTKSYYFEQIVKCQNNIHAEKIEDRKLFFERYKDESYKTFTTAVKNDLQTYLDECDTFIAANGLMKNWKYINKPIVGTYPKLPETVKNAINNLPNSHELYINILDMEEGI